MKNYVKNLKEVVSKTYKGIGAGMIGAGMLLQAAVPAFAQNYYIGDYRIDDSEMLRFSMLYGSESGDLNVSVEKLGDDQFSVNRKGTIPPIFRMDQNLVKKIAEEIDVNNNKILEGSELSDYANKQDLRFIDEYKNSNDKKANLMYLALEEIMNLPNNLYLPEKNSMTRKIVISLADKLGNNDKHSSFDEISSALNKLNHKVSSIIDKYLGNNDGEIQCDEVSMVPELCEKVPQFSELFKMIREYDNVTVDRHYSD